MGIVKERSWWQRLRLTKTEAKLLEDLTKPKQGSNNILCNYCNHTYGLTDFHDCTGKFDEIRIFRGYATNSVKRRLKIKYGDGYAEAATLSLGTLTEDEWKSLVSEFEQKQKSTNLGSYYDDLEEELWNS